MYMKEENTMMDFQQFTGAVKAGLQEFFPDAGIRVTPTEKNNGLLLTGLTIMEPGRRVSPVIYLNEAYCSYRKGVSLAGLVAGLADLYRESRLEKEPELPDVTDFEAVKDIICFRLVNRDRNRERLKKMPHRDFLDLAVTYYIPVTLCSASGSITIADERLREWQVDEEALYRHALKNTPEMYPVNLQSMEEVIGEMLAEDGSGGEMPGYPDGMPHTPAYILRCGKKGYSNAAAILIETALRDFAEQNGDFYILPSSIFEVILVPAGLELAGPGEYCTIVREINNSQVPPGEVLSNNVYYYHADTGEIEIFS